MNLIVSCHVLQCLMNANNSSSVPYQRKKMSSIYLLHRYGWVPIQVARIMASSQPMKMQAKVGATLVPIAVPINWRKCCPLKINTLKRSTNDRRVMRKLVGSFGWSLNLGLLRASWKNFHTFIQVNIGIQGCNISCNGGTLAWLGTFLVFSD